MCAGVFIFCLNRACLKGPLYSAPKHLPACINQKGCNLVVDSHVLGQGGGGGGQEIIVSFGDGEAKA